MNHNSILREHKQQLTFAERQRMTFSPGRGMHRPKRSPRHIPDLTNDLLDYETGSLSGPAERRLFRKLHRAKLLLAGPTYKARV
jgi:hypothetical protein